MFQHLGKPILLILRDMERFMEAYPEKFKRPVWKPKVIGIQRRNSYARTRNRPRKTDRDSSSTG